MAAVFWFNVYTPVHVREMPWLCLAEYSLNIHVFVRNGMTGNGEWAGISTTGLGRSPARESESPALSA